MAEKRQLTPKQEAFAFAYLETGNASEAYRRSYSVEAMDTRTAQKRAQELLHHAGVAARIAELRSQAAEKAVVDQAWVLARLKQNVEVSLCEKTIRLRQPHRDKETGAVTATEIEISAHDAAAANKALELLARHLGMFEVDNAQAGKAVGEAVVRELSDLEFARWIAHKLNNAAKQVESETEGANVIH